MAPFRRWADLPPDLLYRIGDCLDLKWYTSAQGAFTAWRCALAPPSPALLVVSDDSHWCPHAVSLPTRRSFELIAIVSGGRCVGSSNTWLAFSVALFNGQTAFVLLNPISAVEILLPPLIYESHWVSKVVFTPTPAKDDFAAAAICDIDRIAYVTAWTAGDAQIRASMGRRTTKRRMTTTTATTTATATARTRSYLQRRDLQWSTTCTEQRHLDLAGT